MIPDVTKRDYDSLVRGPSEQYHEYQTITAGEALVDDDCAKKMSSTLKRQSSNKAEGSLPRYNSDSDLNAAPMEGRVGARNASVKFVFPPRQEQVYTKTYPVMQTSFV